MSDDELRGLAEEQGALRRVAMLVARGAVPEEVFAAVTREIGQLLPVEYTYMSRYEPDRSVVFVTAWGRGGANLLGDRTRVPLGGNNLSTIMFETGRSGRMDDYGRASGPAGVAARQGGVRSAVATPILVEGRLWGVMAAGSSGEEPLPTDTEARLVDFTELLATAIANAESRGGLTRLAEEQAALRRVATLVARGTPPEEVFAAVAGEVGRLLPVEFAGMARYEPDGTATIVATSSQVDERFPVGSRWALEGKNVHTLVFETGRPARIDSYADAAGPVGVAGREASIRSAIGTPILVEGRLWGAMSAGSIEQPLPADTEERLVQFTELVATAIANAESRAGLTRLAEEQAALQRVATLVARGSPSEELFAAVPGEAGRLLQAGQTAMIRYEPDGTATLVAAWSRTGDAAPLGARERLGGNNLTTIIRQTRRPARIGSYADASGAPAVVARKVGFRSAAGAPVIVRAACGAP